jgi:pilus assembly protein CpaE
MGGTELKIDGGLRVLVVTRSGDVKDDVTAACAGIGGIELEVEPCELEDIGPQLVNSHHPDVVMVDLLCDDPTEVNRLGAIIRDKDADVAVIAMGANVTLEAVRGLMRKGVSDVLPQPVSADDLFTALDAIAQRVQRLRAAEGPGSKIYTFLKSGGGVGATTLAVHTALALGKATPSMPKTCLLDLDLQYGKAALYLDLQSSVSVADLIRSPDRMDSSLLHGVMLPHKSGLDVLAAPREFMALESMEPEVARDLVDLARTEYDYVVVDLPQDWTGWSQAILGRSDLIVLVAQLNVASIRQARRQLDILKEEGFGGVPLAVMLNRYNRGLWGSRISLKEAKEALGRSIDYFIPNNYKLVSEALDRGVALAEVKRRSKVEKEIRRFVASSLKTLTGEEGRAVARK